MAKLNQIIAVVNGKKNETTKDLTEVYRKSSVPELFSGLSRVYTPKEDGGEGLPSEGKRVQYTVKDAVSEFSKAIGGLLDVVATQEVANTNAKADVVVDNVTVLNDVPVSYLLFLEKQLVDMHTFISKLPTLDQSEDWTFDAAKDVYVSKASMSNRSQKVPKSKVLYEATKEHPAQIEKWTEDVTVGTWSTTKFSGAIPVSEKKQLVEKVKKLQEAVKFAREAANSIEVQDVKYSPNILKFLFT